VIYLSVHNSNDSYIYTYKQVSVNGSITKATVYIYKALISFFQNVLRSLLYYSLNDKGENLILPYNIGHKYKELWKRG